MQVCVCVSHLVELEFICEESYLLAHTQEHTVDRYATVEATLPLLTTTNCQELLGERWDPVGPSHAPDEILKGPTVAVHS